MSDDKRSLDFSAFEPLPGAFGPSGLPLLRHAHWPLVQSYVDAHGTAIIRALPVWENNHAGLPKFIPHTSNPSCTRFSGPVRTLREEDEHGTLPRYKPHALVVWLKPEALPHRHHDADAYDRLEAQAEQVAERLEAISGIPLEARMFYPFKDFQEKIRHQSNAALILATTPACADRLGELNTLIHEQHEDLHKRTIEREVVRARHVGAPKPWVSRFGLSAADAADLPLSSVMRHRTQDISLCTNLFDQSVVPLPASMQAGLKADEAVSIKGIDNANDHYAERGLVVWLGRSFRRVGQKLDASMHEECAAMAKALEQRYQIPIDYHLAPMDDALLQAHQAPTALLLFTPHAHQRVLAKEVRAGLERLAGRPPEAPYR